MLQIFLNQCALMIVVNYVCDIVNTVKRIFQCNPQRFNGQYTNVVIVEDLALINLRAFFYHIVFLKKIYYIMGGYKMDDTRKMLLDMMKSYKNDLELIVCNCAYKLKDYSEPLTANQAWEKLLSEHGADEFIDILVDVSDADDVNMIPELLDNDIDALIDKGYMEYFDLYDYFADNALDMDFTIGSDGKFKSGTITLVCGGPGIWIDTKGSGYIVGSWGGTEESIPLSSNLAATIDEYLEETYKNIKG